MAQPLATAKSKAASAAAAATTTTNEPLPLDKRRVTRGAAVSGSRAATAATDDSLPALHADWKKPIQFVVYLPPPELNVRLMDPGKWEAWQVIGEMENGKPDR